MRNWKKKLTDFMIGRNGADDLSQAAAVLGIVLYFLHFLTGKNIFNVLSSISLFYALFRMFSKNVPARSRENHLYKKYIQYGKIKWEHRKTHKVYVCKKCGRIIRVPRKKGRIEVTCPACRTKTVIKS